MDYLTAFVAIAHAQLRLQVIKRHRLLERKVMGIPNFEGLVDAMDKLEFTLDSEASKFHTEISSLGTRGLDAIQKGRIRMSGVAERVARVETFVNKLEGANGGRPLDNSSNISDKPKVVSQEQADQSSSEPPPEQLTVNGVSAG